MNRAHLALAVAGTLTAGIAAVAQAAVPSALPDLNERPPTNIGIAQAGGQYAVGFDTTVVNTGEGAFVVQGRRTSPTGDMVAQQVVGDRRTTVGIMRYVTTFGHEHWHVMPFQRYELHGPSGQVLTDVKQGFCLSNLHDEWCGREQPGLTNIEMGLRPGGNDVYERFKEGQQIPISPQTAPSGRYTLVVRIDPNASFQESETSDNFSSAALDIAWPAGGGAPTLSVIQTCLHSLTCPPGPAPAPAPQPQPQPTPTPAPPPVTALAPNAAPALLRMTLAKSYQYGRFALRRDYPSARTRTSKLRIRSCKGVELQRVRCSVTWRSRTVAWRGHMWLAAFDAPPRWGYKLKVTGRVRNCKGSRKTCTRRLVRNWKLGGPFPQRSS